MASAETQVVNDVMVRVCSMGARVFKNVRGMFLTRNGAPVKAGLLCNGSSDLIGWHTVTITADMVGRDVAVFMALEAKTEKGRVRPEQVVFIDNVLSAGGIAGVVRCAEDVESVINQWFKKK